MDFKRTSVCLAVSLIVMALNTHAQEFENLGEESLPEQYKYSLNKLMNLPANEMFQIADLMPGVMSIDNKLFIREVDPIYASFQINGVDISDPVFGGMGNVMANQYPSPSIFALQNVELNTMLTSAKDNNNPGNSINSNLRRGDYNLYETYLYIKTPLSCMYGLTDNDYRVNIVDESLQLQTTNGNRQYQSSADLNIDFGIGGPLLMLDSSSFFVSWRKYTRQNNAGLEVYDPYSNNLGLLPNQRTFINNFTGSVNLKVSDNLVIDISGMYGISSWENSSWGWLYASDYGDYNQIPEREAKQTANNYKVSFLNASIHNDLLSDWFYNINFGITTHAYESGRKASFGTPGLVDGFDILKPQDNYTINDFVLIPAANGKLDHYESGYVMGVTKDNFLNMILPVKNPLTGYYEDSDFHSASNPYGLEYDFYSEGGPYGLVQFLNARKYSMDLETGMRNKIFNIDNETSIGMNYSTYNYDSYICKPGENGYIFAHSEIYDAGLSVLYDSLALISARQPVKPDIVGGFIQNKAKYKNLSLDLGLRADYFSTIPGSSNSDKNKKEEIHYSPRMDIAYHFFETNKISFAYGEYYKMQNFEHLYNFVIYSPQIHEIYSYPELDPVKSSRIQLSFSSLILDQMQFKISLFQTKFENEISSIYGFDFFNQFFRIISEQHSETRGLDISLSGYITENWSMNLYYCYSQSQYNSMSLYNFLTQSEYSSTDYDIPNKLNLILNYSSMDNDLLSFWIFKPYSNIDMTLTGTYRNGFPYTTTDLSGRAIGLPNAERYPDVYNFNFRITKKIFIDGTSSEWTNDMYIAFSLDIFNLLNSSFIINGQNYQEELTYTKGYFSTKKIYKDPDFSNVETISGNQYDKIGRRLYNANADFDRNGIITQDDRFKAYSVLLEDRINMQSNMSQLSTAFFNITIGF